MKLKQLIATLACLASFSMWALAEVESPKNENSKESNAKEDSSDEKASSQASAALVSSSQTSPVQSAARPYDLDIVAKVQVAGSDAASKAFQTNVLPGMLTTLKNSLPEYRNESSAYLKSISVPASKIVLSVATDARVYFVGEGAGYQNTLGMSTTGGGPLSSDAALIFPNASSSVGFGGSGSATRSASEPLAPGDFVNLGNLKAGTALDFFLIAYGATGGKEFYSTNQSINHDGIVHAVAMAAKGSSYLLISFEDMSGGGDHDYNDVVFAVDLGKTNVAHLSGLGAPEPSLASGALLTGLALLAFNRRRRI